MAKKVFVFLMGFLCAIILSMPIKKGVCQSSIPSNISFSADSNSIYFLDRDEARLYRYNTQGKVTRIYNIKELGKDLLPK